MDIAIFKDFLKSIRLLIDGSLVESAQVGARIRCRSVSDENTAIVAAHRYRLLINAENYVLNTTWLLDGLGSSVLK